MSTYVSKAACRGNRPHQFASYNGFQRQELISRLLRERHVARFVVAPGGYGKTCLALDYAETVFSWAHVFFFNAQSPCFVRDLDNGDLAASCKAADGEIKLVVFDDVPPLDQERANRLSADIDALLLCGCEVIVTCTPSCDVFGQLQRDRMTICAADLLLSDEEIDAARLAPSFREKGNQGDIERRIPALAWGEGSGTVESFLKRTFKEQMPADLLLVEISMLVLREGSLSQLLTFGPFDIASLAEALESYPHLGFDVEARQFHAISVSMGVLAVTARRKLGDAVSRSAFGTSEGLCYAWADALADRGRDVGRACDVVRTFCPRSHQTDWLLRNANTLVRKGCFLPAIELIGAIKATHEKAGRNRLQVLALEAACRQLLGDEDGAAKCAMRVAFDEAAPFGARVYSQVVLVRCGEQDVGTRATAALSDVASSLQSREIGEMSVWELMACAWRARFSGVLELERCWLAMRDAQASDEVLEIAASWLFGLMVESDAEPLELRGGGVESYVRDRLETHAADSTPPDFFLASAGLAMERAHMKGFAYVGGPLSTSALLMLRQAELLVLAQRRKFDDDVRAEESKRSNWAQTHPDAAIDVSAAIGRQTPRNIPILEIKMFGRFDVTIGGVPVDQALFRRKNVRSLLVLLTLNQGREISRETICHTMWPDSADEVSRKGFYSVWSQLRTALTLPDGTCPYLIRHQYGCSLEERHVKSDVARFNEICRDLLFGGSEFREWPALFTELDRDFGNDLMPTETKNPLIVSARNDYRARLVDVLVAASVRIVETSNPQWAIWFARSAISHEQTREDAYVALMRAQIASEQRTAAIMTYHRCRHVLADELGVDPSAETTALYETLLDAG